MSTSKTRAANGTSTVAIRNYVTGLSRSALLRSIPVSVVKAAAAAAEERKATRASSAASGGGGGGAKKKKKKPSARGKKAGSKKAGSKKAGSKKAAAYGPARFAHGPMVSYAGSGDMYEGLFVSRKDAEDATHRYPAKSQKAWPGVAKFLRRLRQVQSTLAPYGSAEHVCVLENNDKVIGVGWYNMVDPKTGAPVVWLNGLDHYIRVHHVKPSHDFFKFINSVAAE